MQSGVLITNGGPHSPEKWAVATAEIIFDINPAMASDRLLQAKRLQLAIVEALIPHHAGVMDRERGHMAGDKKQRNLRKSDDLHTDHQKEAGAEADEAIAAIQAAAKGTPWEGHCSEPERVAAWRNIIASHFMTSKHIEHCWHSDRQNGRAPAEGTPVPPSPAPSSPGGGPANSVQ